MKIFILLTFWLFAGYAWSQPPGETIQTHLSDSGSDIDTFCGFKGQLLLIPTDTFYIINHIAVMDFNRCIDSYDTLQAQFSKLKKVDVMLTGMETDFDTLMVNMHSLESKYGSSLQNSIKNAETLMRQNTTLQNNLDSALSELSEAKHKIKNERWNKLGTKLLWATGGLAAGILIVTVTN
jgi:hypothetical protein